MAILSVLHRFFGNAAPRATATAALLPPHRLSLADVPKYPPYNPGLPAVTPDQIVESQRELIDRLRNAVSLPDPDFERTYLSAIRSYAAFVHLLPASESHHHRGTGGLFRHGLEAGLYGAMHADRMLFVMDEAPARRRVLEPIWRFAAFIAALNHDIGKPVSDVAVLDQTGELSWNPFAGSLHKWAEQHGIEYYHIRFRPGRHQDHEMVGMLALEQVVAADLKQYLAEAGPKLLRWMISAIANPQGAESINPFRDLVMRADRDSVERDLRVNGALQSNMPSVGIAAERFVIDAMRRLVRNKNWSVNQKGARVWQIDGNLYISWNAARDIVRVITEDKTPGVPRDPDSIADMLIERGLAVARESFHGPRRYWMVVPDVLGGVVLKTVRLSTPDLLLDPPPGNVGGKVLPGDEEEPGVSAQELSVTPAPESATLLKLDESQAGQGAKAMPRPVAEASMPPPETKEPRPAMESKASASPNAKPAAEPEAAKAMEPAPQSPKPAQPPLQDDPFKGKGIASEIIASLVEDIQGGKRPADSVRQESGLTVLAWPEAFQGLGMEPRAVLKALGDAGLLEPDPSMPTRMVRDGEEGKKFVALKHREGQSLLALARQRTARTNAAADTPSPLPQGVEHQKPPARTDKPPASAPIPAQPAGGEADLIEQFIRYYLDPAVAPSFPIAQIPGGISLPHNLASGYFARIAGSTPKTVKAALEAEIQRGQPRLALAMVRGSQRIEIQRETD